MKRLAAIVFVVIFAVMTMSLNAVVAFAVDVYTCPHCNRKYTDISQYNDCIDSHNADDNTSAEQLHQCKTCGKLFTDLREYNACVDSHFNNINYHYDKYVGLTIPELLTELTEIFNKTGTVDAVQNVIDKLFDLTYKAADKSVILNAIADLELKTKHLDLDAGCLSDISCLVDLIKEKLEKDEVEDPIAEVENTEAEIPPATGSKNVDITVFATIMVAVAVGFITSKIKE